MGVIAARGGVCKRSMIRVSASGSISSSSGLSAVSSAHASRSSSDSVAPGRARVERHHPTPRAQEEGQADGDVQPRPQLLRQRSARRAAALASRWAGTPGPPSAAPSSSRTRTRSGARRDAAGGGAPRAWSCRTGRTAPRAAGCPPASAASAGAAAGEITSAWARVCSGELTRAAPPWPPFSRSASSGTGSSCSRSSSSERPARGQEEAPAAAGAGQHTLAELAVLQRRAAGHAGVAVGQQRAVDVGHQQPLAAHLGGAQLAGRELTGAVERHPVRQAGRSAGLGRLGAADHHRQRHARHLLLDRALDGHAHEVGGGLLQLTLHRQLQRRRRRRAAVAAAGQPQTGHPVLDPEQLDVAAVGLHVGPYAIEALLDTLLERHRVEAVDQQQAAHHAVPASRGRAPRRPWPRACAPDPRRAGRARRRRAPRPAAARADPQPARARRSGAGPDR